LNKSRNGSTNLTDAGERYRQQCQNALLLLREAEQEASGEQVSPQGKLRISLPTPYAHYRLLPVLASFQQQFPKIEIDVHISNRNVDFFEEQFDLAIRGAAPKESTLIARKIEDAELVMVASPDYLQRNPAPQHPDDLIHHQCIRYELPSSGRFVPWLYLQEGEIHEYSIHGKINCAGDFLGGLTLARHNAGIFQVYRFAVETELSSGALVEILPAYGGITQPFYLLYPHLRHQSLGLRILISFIMDHLRNLAL